MGSRARALLVILAIAAGLTGCASSGGARPRPFPSATRAAAPSLPLPLGPSPTPTPFAAALLRTALALTGIPYRNGGTDPAGFDCSGFVWYVFAQLGADVPRTVSQLFSAGAEVRPDHTLPGDLLFFTTVAPGATHVALALGDGRFVHAPSSRGVVRVESLRSSYWGARFVGVRRVGPDAGGPDAGGRDPGPPITRRDSVPYR